MLQCIVVTPERTVYDQPAEFVALTLFDGEIGIAPGHAPMIGRLGYGEMRIGREAGSRRYYVEGGFVEVLGDVVSVLTPAGGSGGGDRRGGGPGAASVGPIAAGRYGRSGGGARSGRGPGRRPIAGCAGGRSR